MTVRLLQAALNLKHGRAVCCARYRGLQAAGPADRGGGGMSEGLELLKLRRLLVATCRVSTDSGVSAFSLRPTNHRAEAHQVAAST